MEKQIKETPDKPDRSGPEWRRAEVFVNLETSRCEGEGDQEVLAWIETLGQTSSAAALSKKLLTSLLHEWRALPDMPLSYYVTAVSLKLTQAKVLADRMVNAGRCAVCGCEVQDDGAPLASVIRGFCQEGCPRMAFASGAV